MKVIHRCVFSIVSLDENLSSHCWITNSRGAVVLKAGPPDKAVAAVQSLSGVLPERWHDRGEIEASDEFAPRSDPA
jgi:hypothetical protein